MINNSLEKVAYHTIRNDVVLLRATKPRYFENADINKIFRIDKAFFEKYNQIPTKSQLIQLIEHNKLTDITESKLDSLFDIRLNEYDPKWLKDSVEAFIQIKTLNSSVEDLVEYMQTNKVDINNVQTFVSTAKEIILKRNNIVFNLDLGLDFFQADHHIQPKLDTFTTGYPFLNETLGGGYESKTLVVLAGMPKVGKSIWLTNLACNAVKNGFHTAYVSLEMRDKKVLKRFGANLLNVPMTNYDDFSQNTASVKERLSTVGSDMLLTEPGSLHIKEFPASSAGVPDIEAYLQKLEELKNIKLKLIVVDYINILSNWRNPHTENTYMKIKQIAEDLRSMAMRNNWCVVSATQINRAGFNSNNMDMSSISESTGLLHTVDALYGIIQDTAQHLAGQYSLKALALRNAEGMDKRKDFLIDYEYMRISESNETFSGVQNNTNSYDDLFGI